MESFVLNCAKQRALLDSMNKIKIADLKSFICAFIIMLRNYSILNDISFKTALKFYIITSHFSKIVIILFHLGNLFNTYLHHNLSLYKLATTKQIQMNLDLSKISELISSKLNTWGEALIKLLPNILLAAVVLVLGFFAAKYIRKLARKIVAKISRNLTLNNLFSSIVYFTVIGIVLFTVLTILQLDKAVTSILAGAGILGLGLAFAFQDIAANFMSGIFISFRKPLHVGDIVEVKGYMGKVLEVNLRDTVIETFQGQCVIIPNKEVFQNPIENYSIIKKRRFDLDVRVSFDADLEEVKRITWEAVKDIASLSKTDEVKVYFVKFDESSINISVRLWVNSVEQAAYNGAGSEAIMRIKKAYDANNIIIPFPIRTLNFNGNEKLSNTEILSNISQSTSKNDK